MKDSIKASTVVPPSEFQSFERLIQEVDELPIDHKVALVERLMGSSQTGLSVVFGNNQLSGTIVVQINTMDREVMSDILASISHRIKDEGK